MAALRYLLKSKIGLELTFSVYFLHGFFVQCS